MVSLVVMGVSGCGKSSVAAAVAEGLGLPLIEGDEFHSEANRTLMREGIPLTDAHRAEWLDRLGTELARRQGAVLTCSALKRRYRDRLRWAVPMLRTVFIEIPLGQSLLRVASRPGHLFPPGLVASQFDALEPPSGEPGVLTVPALAPLHEQVDGVLRWLDLHHELPQPT